VVVRNVLAEVVYVAEPPMPETLPGIYIQRWFGYLTPQEIYDTLDYVAIPLSLHYGTLRKVLNDITHVTGPWDDANARLSVDHVPRWIGLGMRYTAFIMSPDAFAAISADDYNEATASIDQYQNRMFVSEAEAHAWLLSLP